MHGQQGKRRTTVELAGHAAKVSVLFESNAHAMRASQALLEGGMLGESDSLILRRGKPWGEGIVPQRRRPRAGLGVTAIVVGLACAVVMTLAAEGLDARGVVTALALALGWGALYGVLVGAMSGSTESTTFFEQFDPPEGPDRGRVEVESDSVEVLTRARRHLLRCAGAVAERLR